MKEKQISRQRAWQIKNKAQYRKWKNEWCKKNRPIVNKWMKKYRQKKKAQSKNSSA